MLWLMLFSSVLLFFFNELLQCLEEVISRAGGDAQLPQAHCNSISKYERHFDETKAGHPEAVVRLFLTWTAGTSRVDRHIAALAQCQPLHCWECSHLEHQTRPVVSKWQANCQNHWERSQAQAATLTRCQGNSASIGHMGCAEGVKGRQSRTVTLHLAKSARLCCGQSTSLELAGGCALWRLFGLGWSWGCGALNI